MNSLTAIKNKVRQLYVTNPNIHINVSLSQPKIRLRNHPVTIKSVYPNVFRIEDNQDGTSSFHTLQYSEILTKQLEIVELM